MIVTSGKTGWFHLFFVLLITLGAVYFIRQSLNESFVQWQSVNEVRAAEIQAALTTK